jgi:long-chain acyl-CoA synthetase
MFLMSKWNSLCDLLEPLKNFPEDKPLLAHRQGSKWIFWTAEDFLSNITKLASFLNENSIQKGDRVGIFGNSSPYWLMADFAILSLGAVSVPFLPNISQEHFNYQLSQAKLKTLFVLEINRWQRVSSEIDKIPKIISRQTPKQFSTNNKVYNFKDILEEEHLPPPPLTKISCNDLACIIFTSGSSGTPKGVMLSHDNLLSQVESSAHCFPLISHEHKALSVLPIAHVFEKMVVYYYLSSQIAIYFCSDPKWILPSIQDVKPQIMTFVPRILEKAFGSINSKIQHLPAFLRPFFKKIINKSLNEDPKRLSAFWKMLGNLLLYKKVQNIFGKQLLYGIVGGAYFNDSLQRFFINAGINIYVGYGLTEASPVLATNYPGNNCIGSVGPAFLNVELKISESGEILGRGRGMMIGYLNESEHNQKTISKDGWLHTGDQGIITDEGFLKIQGRIKEMLKTSTGKFVVPNPIENAICLHPLIDHVLIVAEGKPYTTALIFVDSKDLSKLSSNNKPSKELKELKIFIEEINSSLDHWEKVKKFKIIKETISIENGDITPTMKLKRWHLVKKFQSLIDCMYQENGEL